MQKCSATDGIIKSRNLVERRKILAKPNYNLFIFFYESNFSQDFEFLFCFIESEMYKEEWERSDSRYANEQKTKKKPNAEENFS